MIRRLIHFFVLGAAILALRHLTAPRPVLVVPIPADAAPTLVARSISEALLIAEAHRLGWVHTDPVIRRHLARAYGLAVARSDPSAPPDPTDRHFAAALALGMHRTDGVVRRRLLDRATRALDRAPTPTDEALRAFIAAHPDRYASPEQITFAHRFLSSQRRGSALAADAAALAHDLPALGPAPPPALTDPLPLSARALTTATADRIGALFGEPLASALASAPPDRWIGPVHTPHGAHFVRVLARRPARPLPLERVRAAATEDLHRSTRAARRAARLAALRTRWRVVVERR